MIAYLIILIAFYWLMLETDWLRVRLATTTHYKPILVACPDLTHSLPLPELALAQKIEPVKFDDSPKLLAPVPIPLALPAATYQTIVGKESKLQKQIKDILKTKLVITGDVIDNQPFTKQRVKIVGSKINKVVVEARPKTFRIGQGVYQASIVKELLENIAPESRVVIKVFPGYESMEYVEISDNHHRWDKKITPPRLECSWTNHTASGRWTLHSDYGIGFYSVNANGKVSKSPMRIEARHQWPNDIDMLAVKPFAHIK